MFWIMGSVISFLFLSVIMCILVMGARADARLQSPERVKSSDHPPFSFEDNFKLVSKSFYNEKFVQINMN